MKIWNNTSLKYKLLIIVSTVTTTMLLVYAYLTIKQYQQDKTSYIFDTSSTIGQNLANQIRGDIAFLVERMRSLMKFYPSITNLLTDDPFLEGLLVFDFDGEKYTLKNAFYSSGENPKITAKSLEVFAEIAADLFNTSVAIRPLSLQSEEWLLAAKFDRGNFDNTQIVIGVIKQGLFTSAIKKQKHHSVYLLNSQYHSVLTSEQNRLPLSDEDFRSLAQGLIAKMTTSISVDEIQLPHANKSAALVTVVKVGIGDYYLLEAVPKAAAFKTLKKITNQTFYFFGLLVSITLGLSVFLSTYLTKKMDRLLWVTQKVSQGDFNVKLAFDGKDEIGRLAAGFDFMVQRIQTLMKETEHKGRMQAELETAQLVQATLFPPNEYRSAEVELCGYHNSASECGGDWWHYRRTENHFYVMIGDVTGHGAGAALVTSAARSAMSVLELFPDLKIQEILAILNQAVFDVSKSKLGMSFFIGVLEFETGVFHYCNASHDMPFLIRHNEEKITKHNIEPLVEISGPPLGNIRNHTYKSFKINLHKNDRLFFFTDGLPELRNKSEEIWGERRLIVSLIKAINEKQETSAIIAEIRADAEAFQAQAEQNDDITYLLLKKLGSH